MSVTRLSTDAIVLQSGRRQMSIFVYCFHQFGDYSWTGSCEGTKWVHRGQQCHFSQSIGTLACLGISLGAAFKLGHLE